MPANADSFIGVFDSGVGGISVLKELARVLPREDFLYFGDSANAPYGEKPGVWVLERSRRIVEHLLAEGCKAVVIACNTATSAAAAALRSDFSQVPIIGVEPALKPAALAPDVRRILVMATPITLALDKYQDLARTWGAGHEVLDAPCPGLAARIEQGHLGAPDVCALVEELVGRHRGTVDAVVLGCTHYPFIAGTIRDVLGEVALFDGAHGTALQLKRKLVECESLSQRAGAGRVEFSSSKPGNAELELYRTFFSLPTL